MLIKTNLVTGMNISMSSGTFLIILNAHKAAFFLHKNIVKNLAEKANNSSAKTVTTTIHSAIRKNSKFPSILANKNVQNMFMTMPSDNEYVEMTSRKTVLTG